MKKKTALFGALVVFVGIMCCPANAQVPVNFPGITVSNYNPSGVADGKIFLAVGSDTPGIGYYLMILENDGSVVDGSKYKELLEDYSYDFKVQANGLLSYAQFIHHHPYTGGGDARHEIVDSDLNAVETVQMGNGYIAEAHDFQILPNGHMLLLGYYLSEVDMSQIVSGGHPAALVSGGVIQELDAQRNVVFQWRSWDHYDFETFPFNPNRSRGSIVSAFHLNDINQDPDGHIILGTPSGIRKINRQTGEVMWTLGGSSNEFSLIGTGADVSHFGGHATYRLENGNFLMYDNGNRSGTVSSKIHEYTLDETNLTATHVWTWEPPTIIPAWHRGNAQRLPNGNTFIGWGGANGQRIPVCTEVDTNDAVVLEMYFDDEDPMVESYRAFRFSFPAEEQGYGDVHFEVAEGSEYLFTNAHVTIDVDSVSGSGYNEVTVTNEPYAPVNPSFATKSPRVVPVRVIIDALYLSAMTAEVSFDAVHLGFDHPADLTVYYRATPGTGLFTPLTTLPYNPVTKQVRATMTQFGEFIFGYPDLADIAYPPILHHPENYRGVQTNMVIAPLKAESNVVYSINQELPILLSWSPKGFARYHELQVATDPAFTSPVIDILYRTDAYYVWSNALPNTTYHWRARTMIDDFSTGDWSTNTFQTVPPAIEVTVPNGGEAWQRGLDQFILWNDNFAEDVVIDLYKGGAFLQNIVTNPSSGAYEWEVDLGLAAGTDYSMKVSSVTNGVLADISDQDFSIDVPEITSITAATNGTVSLEWVGTSTGVYVDFRTELDQPPWTELAGPMYSSSWTNTSPPSSTGGNYRLRLE